MKRLPPLICHMDAASNNARGAETKGGILYELLYERGWKKRKTALLAAT